MRLMSLEKHLEDAASVDDEEYEDAHAQSTRSSKEPSPEYSIATNGYAQNQIFTPLPQNGPICIPPTIPECDDCDE